MFVFQMYDKEVINCERYRLIFHVTLALCILLAPSYVTTAGTRLSILTSYACHIFFVSTYLWANAKLLLVSSAILGLGAALVFVAQGKCLVENKNPQKVHKHVWIFWFFIELFFLIRDLDLNILKKIININDVSEFSSNTINILIIVFSVSLFFFIQEETNEYTPGGLECIPNGKMIESEEGNNKRPLFDLWTPFQTIFQLAISPKMLLIYIPVLFTGLLSVAYPSSNEIFPISLRIGEIFGALFSAFCVFKNGDSISITMVGFLLLTGFDFISNIREQSISKDLQVRKFSSLNKIFLTSNFIFNLIFNFNT